MGQRRFPPPWSAEELEVCYVVRNHAGQKLAYVYFEEEPGPAIGGQVAHERRGAADRGEYRQAAGATEKQVTRREGPGSDCPLRNGQQYAELWDRRAGG